MVGAFDHLWGQDTHGAVIGGKGLVQLGHSAPNARVFLNQIDLNAHICKVYGGLNTGNSAAYNE